MEVIFVHRSKRKSLWNAFTGQNFQILQYLTQKKCFKNFWTGKNCKSPSEIWTHDRFVVQVLTHCALLLDNNFEKEQIKIINFTDHSQTTLKLIWSGLWLLFFSGSMWPLGPLFLITSRQKAVGYMIFK